MDKTDPAENSKTTLNNTIGSGSILSQDSRNSIFRNNAVDSSISKNNISIIQNRQRQLDLESSAAIIAQQQAFTGFNSGIQELRADIGKLGSGLNGIALLLQQDAATEQSRILSEQEKQRRLAEQQIRIGKENDVEKKIQNAIAEPVEKLVPQVNDLFGNIGNALKILFGGWLTNQTVKAIEASEQGNTDLLSSIKINILKNIGIAVGGLFAINTGFSLVKRTLGTIIGNLGKLFIPKLARAGAGAGKNGPLPGFGKFVTFLSGVLNANNKEYTDSVLAAISLASMVPGPIGLGAKIAGIAFTADEIAEAFGKNIFGGETDKQINALAQKFMGQTTTPPTPAASQKPSATVSPTTPAVPPSPATSSTPASTASTPQQTMMGQENKVEPATSTLTPEKISQFEKAWKYRNNSLARGQIEGAWNKLSLDERRQAKEWAKSKGYDWTEMRLSDPDAASQNQTATATLNIPTPTKSDSTDAVTDSSDQDMSPVTASPQVSAAEITTSAQISNIPKEAQQVGQLPEPNPKITMVGPFTGSNQQQQQPALTNGALTDVPLINSANPDNFYVLYSQLSYNVVT